MINLLIYGGVAIVVLCILFISLTSIVTGKSVDHVVAEIKSHIVYNLIGAEGVMDDMLLRKRNKIEPVIKSGKIVVITGGTRGIGYEVIKLLLQCDMQVIMGCRKVPEGEKVGTHIRADGVSTGELKVFALDTSNNASVREFAAIVKQNCPHINYLINNAGIMFAPYKESPDGYESQFATNYLGHFLLTHLLMPLLKRGGTAEEHARIVNVSSCVYTYGKYNFQDINNKKQYVSFDAYATSKLAQVHFTTYLNRLLLADGMNVQVHAVHPGVVNTDLFENSFVKQYAEWFMKLMFKTAIEGAYPIVYATISPKLEGDGGTYISNCRIQDLSSSVRNLQREEKLFNFTKDILNIQDFGKDV